MRLLRKRILLLEGLSYVEFRGRTQAALDAVAGLSVPAEMEVHKQRAMRAISARIAAPGNRR
jgi:hypothetical protein